MTMPLEVAAQVMRDAMRETVKRHSLWYLVQGGLMILAGIVALIYPALSSVAVVLFLGWLLIIGLLFLRNPGESLLTLTLLLIVLFLVEGISKVIFALTIRPLPNWGWVLGSGIIGILLAFFLWASLPVTAIWLIGVLLGIELISEGAALGYLAWQVRKS